jgi:hypothetical protein
MKEFEKPHFKKFMFSLFGMVLSTGLLMASLWQIEIASAFPGDIFIFSILYLDVE